MFDGQQLGETIVAQVKGFMEREIAPLKAENAELKARLKAIEDRPLPEKGEPGDRGADGVSPDPEAVMASLVPFAEAMVAEKVAAAVAAIPPAEKGEKGESGDAGPQGAPGRDGADGKDGTDGRGVKDLLIDREGQLVATMSDGEMKVLGPVVGSDGKRGKDGRDGFDLTSFETVVLDDDRTVEFKFISGEHEHIATMKWPNAIYRGVFKDGEEYDRGDMATWAGSLWHCDVPTKEKPGTESWTLACKKGRDGKDARG